MDLSILNEIKNAKCVRVTSVQGSYDVHVGANICYHVLTDLLNDHSLSKVIIVTDQTIDECYPLEFDDFFKSRPEMSFKIKPLDLDGNQKGMSKFLNPQDYQIVIDEARTLESSRSDGHKERVWYKCVLPPGETSKSMGCMTALLEIMAHCNLNRSDLLIAFGGGMIGDLAGFAASTYMRGIGYVQIPTTLLAMTDSSVGGKVAVNLQGGKNLAGHFYSPLKVISDVRYLRTLNDRDFTGGMAEVIKYGFIKDPTILKLITTMDVSNKFSDELLELLIVKCVHAKAQTVSEDEFENGSRMILNYGHTFGHGIESVYQYDRYSHGEAVAIGMIVVEYFHEWLLKHYEDTPSDIMDHFSAREIIERRKTIINLLRILKLPCEVEILKELPMAEMKKYVFKDKKSSGKGIKMVLIQSLGNACVVTVPNTMVEQFMDDWQDVVVSYD